MRPAPTTPEEEGGQHKVRLCYSHNDAIHAARFARLCQTLEDIVVVAEPMLMEGPDGAPPSASSLADLRDHALRDSSVTIVLIGENTWQSKFVDWEIAASIRSSHSKPSGLLGIRLPPNHRRTPAADDLPPLPPRLQANVDCGYAILARWSEDPSEIRSWIDEALVRRQRIDPDNSPALMTQNLTAARAAAPPAEDIAAANLEQRPLLLPDIDWVEIPGGEFVYQKGERRSLPTFYLARYPVTNAQYQSFIDAGGYGDKRWWKDLKQPEPGGSRWPQANRPRTGVGAYEAMAFCRWLSAQLGYEVRLPTEEEWERAARGRDGREYPWGNGYESGYANVNEKRAEAGSWHLGQTTAVGVYPQGATTEGVADMAGNVWEWCLETGEDREATVAAVANAPGVLRGGAWFGDPDGARAVRRVRNRPGARADDTGFRLCSSAPIE